MTLVKDQQIDPDVLGDWVKNKIYWNWLHRFCLWFLFHIWNGDLRETSVTKWDCLNLCKLDSSFATRRPRSSTVACFQEVDLRFRHFGYLCSTHWRHPTVLLWTCQWSDHLKLHDLGNYWMGYFLVGPKVPKRSYKVINYFNNSRTINIKIFTIVREVALLGSLIA